MSPALDDELSLAAANSNAAACRAALAAGPDVYILNDESLHGAASFGHAKKARLLLSWGADAHACEDDALLMVSRSGKFECAPLSIQADPRRSWPALTAEEHMVPKAPELALGMPGCMTADGAERLRQDILDSTDKRSQSLRQRLILQGKSQGSCPAVDLVTP